MKSKAYYLGENHLLLALIKQSDIVNKLSKDGNLNKNEFIHAVQNVCSGQTVNSSSADQQFEALNKYGINVCERALRGELDPVIGRDEEIRRMLQILSRRTKNNQFLENQVLEKLQLLKACSAHCGWGCT